MKHLTDLFGLNFKEPFYARTSAGNSIFAVVYFIDRFDARLKPPEKWPIEHPAPAYLSFQILKANAANLILNSIETTVTHATTKRNRRNRRLERIEQAVAGVRFFEWPNDDVEELIKLINNDIRTPAIWFADAFIPRSAVMATDTMEDCQVQMAAAMRIGYDRKGQKDVRRGRYVTRTQIDPKHFACLYRSDGKGAIGQGFALIGAGTDLGRPFCALPVSQHDIVVHRNSVKPVDTHTGHELPEVDIKILYANGNGGHLPRRLEWALELPFTCEDDIVAALKTRTAKACAKEIAAIGGEHYEPPVTTAYLNDIDLAILQRLRRNFAIHTRMAKAISIHDMDEKDDLHSGITERIIQQHGGFKMIVTPQPHSNEPVVVHKTALDFKEPRVDMVMREPLSKPKVDAGIRRLRRKRRPEGPESGPLFAPQYRL